MQAFLVIVAVSAALIFLVKRFFPSLGNNSKKNQGGGCSSCGVHDLHKN